MHEARFHTLQLLIIWSSLSAGAGCHRIGDNKSSVGDVPVDSNLVKLVGTVYVTGNEPFARLAIEVNSGRVYIIAPQPKEVYDELWRLQGTKVELVCKPDSGKLILGEKVIVIQHYRIVQ